MKKLTINILAVKCVLTLMIVTLSFYNGFTKESDSMNRARIKPTLVKLAPQAEQQFYVVKEPGRLTAAFATNKVKWFVNGILGGNEAVGKITEGGIYKAPENTPESPEIHIEARINTGSNKTLWATVLYNGLRPSYTTVGDWGELKDSLKHLKAPTSITLDQNGNILLADGNIKRFTNDGIYIDEIGESKGDYEGSIIEPLNLAVDNNGLIFISDNKTGPPRIGVFSNDGKYQYGFAKKGTSDGKVMNTRGMAFNSKQQFYIGDIDNIRVSVFEHSGEFIQTFGQKGAFPGELNVPHGLTIDPNDDVFVANYFGPCQKFSSDGHLILDFLYPNPPDGPIYITDISSDRWGNVYMIVKGNQKSDNEFGAVVDEQGNPVHIMKYNNNGVFVANIQLSKTNRDALRLAVDDYGKVYVLFEDKEKIGVEVLNQ